MSKKASLLSSSMASIRMSWLLLLFTLLLSYSKSSYGYVYYGLDTEADEGPTLVLSDIETGISPIQSLFIGEPTGIEVDLISWTSIDTSDNTTDNEDDQYLFWTTTVNGVIVANGNVSLTQTGKLLPKTIDAGEFIPEGNDKHVIEVNLTVGTTNVVPSGTYTSYKAGVSIIPLMVVLLLAITTQLVEISLLSAVFVGACIVAGSVKSGFEATLSTYLVGAVADEGHAYVVLFTLFLSGMVGMMERSGGMNGFTKYIAKYAKTPRAGQLACYIVGCMIFFDDYANCLLAGETMRPLFDSLGISREKLAFIVDATAAPIASVSPISSWVGFEVDLIQEQIDRIIDMEGTDNIGINTSGLGVFLQSVKYRYYPIFMIVFMFVTIISKRDFGPMLIAERKVTVYERKDGGDGGCTSSNDGINSPNKPRNLNTGYAFNMFVPVAVLVFLIFWLIVQTGDIPGTDQSIMDKIENSDSYTSLLWGTMGATLITVLFYIIQWYTYEGKLKIPGIKYFCSLICKKEGTPIIDEANDWDLARPLLSIPECLDSFLHGMARIFPALIILNLAWASGAVMVAVGADRLFARWITGGLNPDSLPTMSFLISFFIALATGTSWGTMTILFPLLLVPTYIATDGDPTMFYAVTAGILSGSVAGDHVSPISDTTVLSALASECNLLSHVVTQSPYVTVVIIVSILCGTIPIGYSSMPNLVGIFLGFFALVLFVFVVCVPVASPSGRYDIITEGFQKMRNKPSLEELREYTKAYYAGEILFHSDEGKTIDPSVENEEIEKNDSNEYEEIEHTSEEDVDLKRFSIVEA